MRISVNATDEHSNKHVYTVLTVKYMRFNNVGNDRTIVIFIYLPAHLVRRCDHQPRPKLCLHRQFFHFYTKIRCQYSRACLRLHERWYLCWSYASPAQIVRCHPMFPYETILCVHHHCVHCDDCEHDWQATDTIDDKTQIWIVHHLKSTELLDCSTFSVCQPFTISTNYFRCFNFSVFFFVNFRLHQTFCGNSESAAQCNGERNFSQYWSNN